MLCFVFLMQCLMLLGQTRSIQGKVSDQTNGQALPGVSVKVVGTTTGTSTDGEGRFTLLQVPNSTVTLEISFVGYTSQKIIAPASTTTAFIIEMVPTESALDEVVVTALGIERKAKSLTYSTQVVKGEELTKVKDINPMNNLTGKVSGLQINRSSAGMGGSVNIILRGMK
ncbi:MAG: carboxypeptidase-like regulatory domain-containing protein, partial [Sphingobacterium sp.]